MNQARGNGRIEGVVGGLAGFTSDVTNLAELQARLALLDLKESAARATMPLAVLVVGSAVLIGCVPVALVGIGLVLSTALGIGLGWSLLLTSAVAGAIAGLGIFLALRVFPRSFQSFRRSREELDRNLAWIRTVLTHSGRSISR